MPSGRCAQLSKVPRVVGKDMGTANHKMYLDFYAEEPV